MAKVAASYHNLNGGTAAWALQALTGDYCCVFMLDAKVRTARAVRACRT